MKRRLEEELAEYAFGDASPERAQELKRLIETDPEAASLFATYRDMREELRHMVHVPEPQLSTERLREAILNKGLSETPSRTSWNWMWMPAAAACAAFAFAFMRAQPPQTQPTLVDNSVVESPLRVSENSPLKAPAGSNSVHVFSARVTEDPPEILNRPSGTPEVASSPEPAPSSPLRRRQNREERPSTLVARNDERTGKEQEEQIIALSSAAAKNDPVTAPAPASATKSNQSEQIVLIQAERDSETGAHKATEVESASNVIIGS
jgi:hypothetical protein